MNKQYTFFYTEFEDSNKTFVCAEQYMMYRKALIFKDYDIASKIMMTTSPREHKKLGRLVKNFDLEEWNHVAKMIVYNGNYMKFMQNPELKKKLLATKETILAEASPFDTVWGVGLGMGDPLKLDKKNWRGTNWLGIALTDVRDSIIAMEELK